MNEKPSNHETLERWLKLTQDEEMDCDRFADLIAPWLEQRITDPKLLELLHHHRRLCAECEEEVALVEAALGKEP